MTKREAFDGRPYAGNPHVRFDEGKVRSATPGRGSLLCKLKHTMMVLLVAALTFVATAEDAYIQSTGSQAIDIGYLVKPNTKIVVDYALTDWSGSSFVFGANSSESVFAHYINPDARYAWYFRDGDTPSYRRDESVAVTADRRIFEIDGKGNEVRMIDAVSSANMFRKTRQVFSNNDDPLTKTNSTTLAVFARKNADGNFNSFGKLKLYSMKIFEYSEDEGDFVLVHHYLPYIPSSGRVIGLKDVVSGQVFTKAVGEEDFLYGGDTTLALPSYEDDLHAFDVSEGLSNLASPNVRYNGERMLTLLEGGTFEDVKVDSGTLRIGGAKVSDMYWRITFTDAASGTVPANPGYMENDLPVSLALSRFHMFSLAGSVSGKLFTSDAPLAVETYSSSWIEFIAAKDGGWMEKLGWSFSNVQSYGFTNGLLNADNPIVVSFQKREEDAYVCGYGMTQANKCNVGQPGAWTIESRPDEESGWIVRDVRSGQRNISVNGGYDSYGNGGKPYLFSSGADGWAFIATGIVEVAENATLDLSEISTANIAISSLKVDMTHGAGAITRFVPAMNGTLYLTNVREEDFDSDGKLTPKIVLPITIGEISSETNLASWKVYVNGVVSNGSHIVVSDGKFLAISPRGMKIILK